MASIADVAHALHKLEIERARLARAEDNRDQAIREAIAEGLPVQQIARAAGISRARVYQIRDGKR